MVASLGKLDRGVISATHKCVQDRVHHSYNRINAPTSVFFATECIDILLSKDAGSFAGESTPRCIYSLSSRPLTTEYNNATTPVTGFSLNGDRHNHEVTTDSDTVSAYDVALQQLEGILHSN